MLSASARRAQFGLGQRIEIGDDHGPGAWTEGSDAVLERSLQHQSKEAAEHVTTNVLIQFVKNRTGLEEVLRRAERMLHGPELLLADHSFAGVEIGIGAQHEDAVELRLTVDLCRVDGKVPIANRLQIASEACVADQCLVASGELTLQC